jgi:hypothetical protein
MCHIPRAQDFFRELQVDSLGVLWFAGFPKKTFRNQLSLGIDAVEPFGLQDSRVGKVEEIFLRW